MTEGQTPIPGWYGDPFDPSQIRWWDGATWTEHTKPFPVPEPAPAAAPEPAPGAYQAPVPGVEQPGIVPAEPVDPAAAAASVLPGAEPVAAAEPAPPVLGVPGHVEQYAPPNYSPPPAESFGSAAGTAENAPFESGAVAGLGGVPASPWEQPAQSGTPVGEYQQPFASAPVPGGFGAYGDQYGQVSGPGGPQSYADLPSADSTGAPADAPKKSSKALLVLLIILGVVIIVAAAVWFFMLRPTQAPTPASSPRAPTATMPSSGAPSVPGAPSTPGAPGVGAIAPASCSSAVAALTADGSASTVVARLQAAAANQGLAEAAGFFTDLTQQMASLMASSGSPCVDAAKQGQAPAEYAAFIELYSKATHDGAAIAAQGAAANGILTPDQAAALRADASALATAQSAVAPAAPSAAPVPAS